MHKRLAKFLNFTNEGKEINVKRVLRMLNSKNENVRNLILNHETNEHLHQNAPEDAIKIAICECIVEFHDETGWDILQKWFGLNIPILEKSLNTLFNDTYYYDYIQRAYDYLNKQMPYEEDTRNEYEETNAWGT